MFKRLTSLTAVFSVLVVFAVSAFAENEEKAPAPKKPEKIMIYDGDQWKVQLYGFVKVDAVYNTKNVLCEQAPFFVMPQKGKTDDETRGSLVASARASRLGFKMNTPEFLGAKGFALIEADFWGDTANSSSGDRQGMVRMRHAFAKFTWPTQTFLLIGQFNMLGIQELVIPEMVTFQPMTASGFLLMREAQVRVGQSVGDKDFKATLEVTAARAQGNDGADILYTGPKGISGDERGVGEASMLPIFQSRLTFQANPSDKLSIVFGGTGSFMKERHTPWKDENGDKAYTKGTDTVYDAVNVNSWFAMGFLKIAYDFVSISGAYTYAQNIDQNLGGIGQGVVMDGDDFNAVKTQCAWGQLVLNLRKLGLPLQLAGGYGFDNPDDKYLATGSGRTKNSTVWGNAWFYANNNYRFGLEVAKMDTEWKDAGTATDYRTQGTFMFIF